MAKIINVPSDQPTIQQGIDQASNGDSIYVAPGIYQEKLEVINKSIRLYSSSLPDSTILEGTGIFNSILRVANNQSDTIVVSGFTFRYTDRAHVVVFNESNSTNIIERCVFYENNYIVPINYVDISASSKVIIRENIFYDGSSRYCIHAREEEPVLITNNTFYNNYHAIYSENPYTEVVNNIIYGNTSNACTGDFYYLDYNNICQNGSDNFPGIHGISICPQFADTTSRDFRLMPNSSCLNRGDPAAIFMDPDYSRSDIGAFSLAESEFPIPYKFSYSESWGIDSVTDHNPLIIWQYYDTATSNQEYFELEVGTDRDWSEAEMWTTGIVQSFETSILYDGLPLEDNTIYYLRLRVHNGSGWGEWRNSHLKTYFGNIIHVPDDYYYIWQAVDAADDGDTVLVASGVHYDSRCYYDNKALVVMSEAGADSTILVPIPTNRFGFRMEAREPKKQVLDGFTFDDGGDQHMVWVSQWSIATIKNCVFKNYRLPGYPHFPPGVVLFIADGNCLIENNVFYNNFAGNSEDACIGVTSADVEIRNNTFHKNRRVLIQFYEDSNIKFLNNIVTDCITYGIYTFTHYEAEYNLFYNNFIDFYQGTDPGTNNLYEDPLYVDGDNYDLRLSFDSPCINSGNPDFIYNDSDGTRNDMGGIYFPLYSPHAKDINLNMDTLGPYINDRTPTIFWSFFDTVFTQQSGYEIEVGTDNDWTIAENWSSGQVYSSDTFAVYSGVQLEDWGQYYYRIRLYNGDKWGVWRNKRFFTRFPDILKVPSDYSTIQNAIDNTFYHDTVLVEPGIYSAIIEFPNHPITLRSEYGPDSTMLYSTEIDTTFIHILNESDGSTLEGFTFTGLIHSPKIIDIGYITSNFKIKNNRFLYNDVDTTIKSGQYANIILEKNLLKYSCNHCTKYSLGGYF
ncbi:MAG: right-handed parallel beta-helix repeat-containing protein, partial [Bacteroidota bacterium]